MSQKREQAPKCRSNEEEKNVVQTVSGPHPASYPMGTGDYFPGGKAAEA
jgi:hypothetical protein